MNQTDKPAVPARVRKITLVGNGSFQNRGCEAIVRGTVEILRAQFGEGIRVAAGAYAQSRAIDAQNAAERDAMVRSFSMSGGGRRWSREWWATKSNQLLRTRFATHLWQLLAEIPGSAAALQVGGDNYTLDYGPPTRFMGVDRFLAAKGVPVAIWGASVGPFDADPEFEKRMLDHLAGLAAIFVRESRSYAYLWDAGLEDNVFLVADPAFLMDARKPEAISEDAVPEGAIGLNLSPMIGRYRGGYRGDLDLEEWTRVCADAVRLVVETHRRPVLLVPHVSAGSPLRDDFHFLARIQEKVGEDTPAPVRAMLHRASAAELKWIISRCSVFAGARTHSTIAALGSLVPTLSISYSRKSLGINDDIYGHTEFCLPVADFRAESLAHSVGRLLDRQSEIRERLEQTIPTIRQRAMSAGSLLKEAIAG